MMDVFIHDTAEVSDKADIGLGTKIWNNAQIRENVKIGTNCIVSKNVYIDAGVNIGDRVKIQNNVNVYHGVTVGNDVFLGPSMTFTNDMYPRAFNLDWEVSETKVEDGASIGANATIICGVNIGKYSMIGSGSVVKHDVPQFALVVGNPAKKIDYVCKCGCRLWNGMECSKCGKKYRFISNLLEEIGE